MWENSYQGKAGQNKSGVIRSINNWWGLAMTCSKSFNIIQSSSLFGCVLLFQTPFNKQLLSPFGDRRMTVDPG